LALSLRRDLFTGPCESLIFGEFPPAYAAQPGTHLRGLTNCEQEILDLLFRRSVQRGDRSHLVHFFTTVEHRVSASLGKLGASTRERTGREAIKLGLTRLDRSSVAFSLDATDNE
jgi:hypothetical protein